MINNSKLQVSEMLPSLFLLFHLTEKSASTKSFSPVVPWSLPNTRFVRLRISPDLKLTSCFSQSSSTLYQIKRFPSEINFSHKGSKLAKIVWQVWLYIFRSLGLEDEWRSVLLVSRRSVRVPSRWKSVGAYFFHQFPPLTARVKVKSDDYGRTNVLLVYSSLDHSQQPSLPQSSIFTSEISRTHEFTHSPAKKNKEILLL